jgi:hypothetical protein
MWSSCGRVVHRLASQLDHLLGGNTGSRDDRPRGLEARWCSTGQRSAVSRGKRVVVEVKVLKWATASVEEGIRVMMNVGALGAASKIGAVAVGN